MKTFILNAQVIIASRTSIYPLSETEEWQQNVYSVIYKHLWRNVIFKLLSSENLQEDHKKSIIKFSGI